ncbi:MAG: SDR family oxidoreductase [Chloroflexi bacterium]|nr:SDR family oxidoreductase [Chloroflexota bacterium]
MTRPYPNATVTLTMNFHDKVAIITGAGSGLGQSLALQLYTAGAKLALCDVNMPGLEETLHHTKDNGKRVSLHRVDVSNRSQMLTFADEVIDKHGHADILINNAGVSLTPARFEDIPDQQFEKVLNINMWGVYNGTFAFLPHLRTRTEASIVNISSLAGLVGLYGYSAYSMSKFAVRGLSETLQSELAGSGINVLLVYPGGIKTNIIKNAPDLSDAQRESAHTAFTKTALLSSDMAARKILNAVRKKKKRVILGIDAKLVYTLRTLFPRRFPAMIKTVFSQAMFGDEDTKPDQ